MSTVIQIKSSTGLSSPTVSNLAEGELRYVQDRSIRVLVQNYTLNQ